MFRILNRLLVLSITNPIKVQPDVLDERLSERLSSLHSFASDIE
jgi:hypothetical protein